MMAGGSPAELNILIHLPCIKSFSPRDVSYDIKICEQIQS